MRFALAGNPNSGKTTLFNAITGKIEQVGNWAGVTIAKKEGDLKRSLNQTKEKIRIVDLPGVYSLTPYTSEESITYDFIKADNPDAIINIVDSTNLSRSLFFTTQLLELGIPLVIALNKGDLLEKKGIRINQKALSEKLGVPVIETTSTQDKGLLELISAARLSVGKSQSSPFNKQIAEDKERFIFVENILKEIEIREIESHKQTTQDSWDRIITHKYFGIPIFAAVIYGVFSISQTYLGPFLADFFVGWIDLFYDYIANMLNNDASPILKTLLLDGIIGGVGAVVGFLPLIMVLFFMLALLEDSGYMARVAVVMDRYLKKVGLSGKSIIPMIIGTGCAIPGIMSTRTIKNEVQRKTTAMLTPFMPCGAKLPIIALFAGVFFEDAAWVGTLMYFVAIIIIIVGALLIQKITKEGPNKNYFILELPDYKIPSIKRATIMMLSRGKSFVVKAATIILVCNAIVQIMVSTGILEVISAPLAFLFIPLGFGVWQLTAAAITGFIAKENVVGTLAVVYGINNFIDTESLVLTSGASDVASVMGLTSVGALAYLMFNLFTPPCFAAIGAMNSEMDSKKWLWAGIGFQFGTGYTVSFFVYQIGTLLTTGSFGVGVLPGLVGVVSFALIINYLIRKKDQEVNLRFGEVH